MQALEANRIILKQSKGTSFAIINHHKYPHKPSIQDTACVSLTLAQIHIMDFPWKKNKIK
jgi:hypothetical protein